MENKSKVRMICLYQILVKTSDAEHTLSTAQLIHTLQDQYGIDVTRNTITNDLKVMCESGIGIAVRHSTQNRYYYEGHLFDTAELKILMDAVASSKFITEKRSRELTQKLLSLTNIHTAERLRRHLSPSTRAKSDNELGYYIVDAVNQAIIDKRRISFQYMDYDANKKPVLRRNGVHYIVSPYDIVWDGDYYYVIGFDEEKQAIRHYRLDRIKKQPEILNEKASPRVNYEPSSYRAALFRMFGADHVTDVTLQCEANAMKGIIDAFGKNVHTAALDEDHFVADVRVGVSPMFYRWVFGFSGRIKILGPESVRDAYREMLQKAMEDM